MITTMEYRYEDRVIKRHEADLMGTPYFTGVCENCNHPVMYTPDRAQYWYHQNSLTQECAIQNITTGIQGSYLEFRNNYNMTTSTGSHFYYNPFVRMAVPVVYLIEEIGVAP